MTEIDTNRCCDQYRENIPWYLNGTLSDKDREALVAHIESCDVCRDDIHVHATLRESALDRDVEPLLPQVSPSDILDRDSSEPVSPHRRVSRKWLAIAAGVSALGVALLMSFYAGQGVIRTDRQFETATSAGAGADIDYVLQVRFASSVAPGDRNRVAAELPGAVKWNVNDTGVFEIHVQLATPSLAALEEYENRAESMAGIESAEFTALQLPMK